MFRKCGLLVALPCVFAAYLAAQGLNTQASKEDWEEINFEFNSAVLSDGYPSLLRLADLLHNNPGYHVRIEGNTDNIGGQRANDRLGLARANTVRDFLVKYGANPNQIETASRGKNDQKYPGYKNRYSRTDVPRWMNRRVVLTVTDQNGRTVGDGGVREAIQAIPPPAPQPNCCDDILKRLDQITQMLKDMNDQNANLRQQLQALQGQQNALQGQVSALPKPLTEQQTAQVVDARLAQNHDPRFSLLGLNFGSDDQQHFTADASGRFFAPFKENFAIQAQGQYLYFRDHHEAEVDLGLVNRLGRVQLGLFGSAKNVDIGGIGNGTLAQVSGVADWIFGRGKVGVYGVKGFLGDQQIGSSNVVLSGGAIAPNLFNVTYLRAVDQIGGQGTVGLWRSTYVDFNVGYLHSVVQASRPGGSVRFVFPFGQHFALNVEGGVNENYLTAHNTGRATFGILFGNVVRPKEFALTDRAVPMLVPQVHYETFARVVHRGFSPPVANAGPNQLGVPAGTITLNGSNSYDPNGEALTYQWTQVAGPTVALSGANLAIATFQAVTGQTYSFRLTVRNTDGLQASAQTTVTTTAPAQATIVSFTANPSTINAGQSTVLSWVVQNATTVTISPGVGSVNPANGSVTVSPTATTTYTLTASNANGQHTETAIVTVNTPQPQFAVCTVAPANITAGESATIYYQTLNATSVTISPATGAALSTSGTVVVSPTTTTTYNLTATNSLGTANCSVTVQVTAGNVPRIVSFTANPTSIGAGSTSTLSWVVDNATSVTINNGVGTVQATGSATVSPTATTTYTLTATNASGNVTAQVTVTVSGTPPPSAAPKINSFTATPPQITPGGSSVLSCLASNAVQVVISGVGPVSSAGTLTVSPTQTTTYVCVAVGQGGTQQASANVTVTVGPASSSTGPPSNISSVNASCSTSGTSTVCTTVVRQISLSITSTVAGTTFYVTSQSNASVVLNPTSSTPTVQLSQQLGDYYFTVVSTGPNGTSTQVLDIRYVGEPFS